MCSLSLDCGRFSRTGRVDGISAEVFTLQLFTSYPPSPLPLPATTPHTHIAPHTTASQIQVLFLLPDTGILVLCKQCPIFIVTLVHAQAAVSVVSPRKACDDPGGNSQASQNCAKERAVDQSCTLP